MWKHKVPLKLILKHQIQYTPYWGLVLYTGMRISLEHEHNALNGCFSMGKHLINSLFFYSLCFKEKIIWESFTPRGVQTWTREVYTTAVLTTALRNNIGIASITFFHSADEWLKNDHQSESTWLKEIKRCRQHKFSPYLIVIVCWCEGWLSLELFL